MTRGGYFNHPKSHSIISYGAFHTKTPLDTTKMLKRTREISYHANALFDSTLYFTDTLYEFPEQFKFIEKINKYLIKLMSGILENILKDTQSDFFKLSNYIYLRGIIERYVKHTKITLDNQYIISPDEIPNIITGSYAVYNAFKKPLMLDKIGFPRDYLNYPDDYSMTITMKSPSKLHIKFKKKEIRFDSSSRNVEPSKLLQSLFYSISECIFGDYETQNHVLLVYETLLDKYTEDARYRRYGEKIIINKIIDTIKHIKRDYSIEIEFKREETAQKVYKNLKTVWERNAELVSKLANSEEFKWVLSQS